VAGYSTMRGLIDNQIRDTIFRAVGATMSENVRKGPIWKNRLSWVVHDHARKCTICENDLNKVWHDRLPIWF
jgi:hypothetical protein